MGLFDLPSPVLAWADGAAGAVLPPVARLVLWALLGSAVSMALYRLLSSQGKMARLKAEIAGTRGEIAAYDGDLDGMRPLLMRSIGLSLRQVALAVGPAVLASLPLLVLLVWLENAYGFALPQPGETIEVRLSPAAADARWQGSGSEGGPGGADHVVWPDDGSAMVLVDGLGHTLLSLPPPAAVPVIHKRLWWNALIGNPLGYLPEESPVDEIEIELPRQRHLDAGPSWLGRWETVFFTVLVLASVAIKVVFHIH